MPNIQRDSNEHSLFLSEFSGSLASGVSKRGWIAAVEMIPILISAMGFSALILGQLSGANGLRGNLSYVQVRLSESRTDILPKTFDIKAGFLVEPNHGIFYALVFPVFCFFALRFFKEMSSAFWILLESKRLNPPLKSAVFGIWKRNYLAFSRVPLFLILFVSLFLFLDERRKYQLVENGRSSLLGWVQADLVEKWEQSSIDTLVPIARASGLEKAVRVLLEKKANVVSEEWGDVLERERHSRLSLQEALRSGEYKIDWEGVFKNGLVMPHKRWVDGGVRGQRVWLFKAFLVVAMVVQAVCIAFGVWFLLKFFWVMRELENAFRSDHKGPLRIIPKFDDKQLRYGIKAFDPAYRAMVAAVGVVAWWFPFNFLSNVEKGGEALFSPGAVRFGAVNQLLLLLVLALGITILVVHPLVRFQLIMKRRARAELRRCDMLEGAAVEKGDNDEQQRLINLKDIIISQSTWPKGDMRAKLWIAVIFVASILLPTLLVGALSLGVFGFEVQEEVLRAIATLKEAFLSIGLRQ